MPHHRIQIKAQVWDEEDWNDDEPDTPVKGEPTHSTTENRSVDIWNVIELYDIYIYIYLYVCRYD